MLKRSVPGRPEIEDMLEMKVNLQLLGEGEEGLERQRYPAQKLRI